MKKNLILLIVGMVLVVIGTLLKINGNNLSQYVMITGLTIEVYVLATMVIQSLKK
ncbi:GldL-related protein [Flavobacterium sp.]|uniref:GldL-related protein n=1 Tax=Flavobacterium sp. TaxID=239 RepID=UPI003BE65B91